MKFLFYIFLYIWTVSINLCQGADFKKSCIDDLDFIHGHLVSNSAPYKNESDIKFNAWLENSLPLAKELADQVNDKFGCYYVLKYYLNGFLEPTITVSYSKAPDQAIMFPGFLTALQGEDHLVIYKNPNIAYLKDIFVGDKIVKIDDLETKKYFEEYILPFYSNSLSKFSKISASINVMLADSNSFIIIPKKVTIERDGALIEKDLKYTVLTNEAVAVANNYRKPKAEKIGFSVMPSGVWIKLPNFFPNLEEAVIFNTILANLQTFAKKDYIIFDLRGNNSGISLWSKAIIRNLWGDQYIKSLGDKHDYNKFFVKQLRVTRDNFAILRSHLEIGVQKEYLALLNKKSDFLVTSTNIFNEKKYLYTNNKSSQINAKIILFTDNFCSNYCWYFVREMKQIPGTIHLGDVTDIQTPYYQSVKKDLPSGNFSFFYPVQIAASELDNINYAHIPEEIYDGNYEDDAEIANWILNRSSVKQK